MGLNFGDSSIVLTYLQIKLKEQYNPNVMVTGDYYTVNYNNYGFAHFIAKYLNTMYPPVGDTYSTDLPDNAFDNPKTITDTISIANYFLSDNNGNVLKNDLVGPDIQISDTSVFQKIYGTDISAIFDIQDPPLMTSYTDLSMKDGQDHYYINSPYLETLLKRIEHLGYIDRINDNAKKDRVYTLPIWETPKQICEIDDLVLSYLLGRTITPESSMEDIYYVQQLFLGSDIPNADKGKWVSSSGNLSDSIIQYQKLKVDPYITHPLFVTGYFDIFTEASILRDRGEQTYGIHGL